MCSIQRSFTIVEIVVVESHAAQRYCAELSAADERCGVELHQ